MPDGSGFPITKPKRNLPANVADRLIVALDVDSPSKAAEIVKSLEGVVSFFKIGMRLFCERGVNELIDGLVSDGKQVFLDYKMFDIGETVKTGVESVAKRGVSFVTVHGDPEIMTAAVQGRGQSDLKVFAVSVLTSLNDDSLKSMGYSLSVKELIKLRVGNAVRCGCDGIIASPNDEPDEIRGWVNDDNLLIATPGIRMKNASTDDHLRPGTPADAIEKGADYLVVGRPILNADNREKAASEIIAEMQKGAELRLARTP